MSRKSVHESFAKALLRLHCGDCPEIQVTEPVVVESSSNLDILPDLHPWLLNSKIVVKPDQLIKRRGKLNLIGLDLTYNQACSWLKSHIHKSITIENVTGELDRFILEPFIPHFQENEHYFCIISERGHDTILYNTVGGICVDPDSSHTLRIRIPVENELDLQCKKRIKDLLTSSYMHQNSKSTEDKSQAKYIWDLTQFIFKMVDIFRVSHATLMEFNPLIIRSTQNTSDHTNQITTTFTIVDVAMQLDSTAFYITVPSGIWPEDLIFPCDFGRKPLAEERYIEELDSRSGASLKLRILNPEGKIWTMVAGGGASVIYSDTVCDLGAASELANYGEYSGAPTESQTFEYANTILKLMTKSEALPESHMPVESGNPYDLSSSGKILLIGGGIANFTNVSSTFSGIIRALEQFKVNLHLNKVTIFVRRGGPNYQEGLKLMRQLGDRIKIPIFVFGTEVHMTAIVSMALGKTTIPETLMADSNYSIERFINAQHDYANTKTTLPDCQEQGVQGSKRKAECELMKNNEQVKKNPLNVSNDSMKPMFDFTSETTAIVWGTQNTAIQGMLDFDFLCRRDFPSVVAVIYPFSGDHLAKFYFGHKEILIPVYKNMSNAFKKHPDAEVFINFASHRSVYDVCLEVLEYGDRIRCIANIAEGVPERLTQLLTAKASAKNICIIGPATVGGIKPGCFKIGNTGGMLDNIIASKLYRPGSVAYVSRSGGMSNELNNIVSRNTDGVYEGIAIGGDKYPGTNFMDHIMRYQNNPAVKIILLLGEIGGHEEYAVCDALTSRVITKPVVAWCIGTCSSYFSTNIQFGHANACASSQAEASSSKNSALKRSGAIVPSSFDDLGIVLKDLYTRMVNENHIIPSPEVPPPTIPIDYSWAMELGLIRRPSSFISSICDERGKELLYCGVPVSQVIEENLGIGGTIGLLWFQRRLPDYFCRYIEMCLILTADHGPAVSGAHNTMVTARANKDLVSSLCSGLLTIGDRFGGAVNSSANMFYHAYMKGQTPLDFVIEYRKKGVYIQGIGHRVKSINNPDSRVKLLKDYVREHLPHSELLDYALKVEAITTSKKPNLILNVDGTIGVTMIDMMLASGCFTPDEVLKYLEIDTLNAIFVLGRTIGFVGHFLDQKRFKQGLYRHPWDDITHIHPDHMNL